MLKHSSITQSRLVLVLVLSTILTVSPAAISASSPAPPPELAALHPGEGLVLFTRIPVNIVFVGYEPGLAPWEIDPALFGQILPAAVLEAPRLGSFNLHASLLPRWRGAAPIARAIEAGDQTTGITIMQMAQGLDTGDMLCAVTLAITPEDTAATLHDRLAEKGAQALMLSLIHI